MNETAAQIEQRQAQLAEEIRKLLSGQDPVQRGAVLGRAVDGWIRDQVKAGRDWLVTGWVQQLSVGVAVAIRDQIRQHRAEVPNGQDAGKPH